MWQPISSGPLLWSTLACHFRNLASIAFASERCVAHKSVVSARSAVRLYINTCHPVARCKSALRSATNSMRRVSEHSGLMFKFTWIRSMWAPRSFVDTVHSIAGSSATKKLEIVALCPAELVRLTIWVRVETYDHQKITFVKRCSTTHNPHQGSSHG
jgi:hypothetical protein